MAVVGLVLPIEQLNHSTQARMPAARVHALLDADLAVGVARIKTRLPHNFEDSRLLGGLDDRVIDYAASSFTDGVFVRIHRDPLCKTPHQVRQRVLETEDGVNRGVGAVGLRAKGSRWIIECLAPGTFESRRWAWRSGWRWTAKRI